MEKTMGCILCPRKCGADRKNGERGFCGGGGKMKVARASLHMWEEPPVSGKNGSGTVFFSGCALRCVYCQNIEISRGLKGKEIDGDELVRICFRLKEMGAHNINLVTPSHYAGQIKNALLPVKDELALPIVCNTGGYDSPEVLEEFAELADVFLPDFKYALGETAKRLSGAQDYPEVALSAIKRMWKITGDPVFSEDGLIKRGVIVRHLCLPGERKNSIEAVRMLGETFSPENIRLSLMSQYTPIKGMQGSLARRLTTFEYESVMRAAQERGFLGYYQGRESADTSFIPDFDLTGVE